MLKVYKATRQTLLSSVVLSVLSHDLSYAEGTLAAGSGADREVVIGQVLGKVLFGTPTEDHTDNTGNGAMSGLALKANAQLGDYTVECITATTDAATFAVFDPLGRRMADAATDAAYDNGEIAFTIADGATDFIVGDAFTITVPEGSGEFVELSLTAVDGSARPAGVSASNETAPDGTSVPIVVLERLATIKSTGLVYPSGASSAQKAAIVAALDALHIKTLSAA
jgi:hypothetical protein